MELTWLGWAGAELEADDATLVIDPLADPGAVFAPFGERAAAARSRTWFRPRAGRAVAGLVTHLHRDHADAARSPPRSRPARPCSSPRPGEGTRSRSSRWRRRTTS